MYRSEFLERDLAILQEISRAIVVSDDVGTIACLMLDLAIRHTGAEKGSLMLLDGNQELSILDSRGIDPSLAATYRVRVGEGVAGMVARSGEAVLVEDIRTDARFLSVGRDRYRTRSFISCPILGEVGVLGVLNINDKISGEPFTPLEFSLLKIVASQAAIALKNARLLHRLKSKALELEEVNRMLVESDIVRTEFMTRISHELRTPLNSIKGAAFHLQNTERFAAGDQGEFQRMIGSETDKLIAIVETQLDFLHLGGSGRVLKKTVFPFGYHLLETLRSRVLGEVMASKNLTLRVEPESGPVEVLGDFILVNQMLVNLIEGVIHYLEDGAAMTCSLEKGDQIELSLISSSRLPESVLKNHFGGDSFYYDDQSSGSIRLHLALKTAEAHGWKWLGVSDDSGFRITLQIPHAPSGALD
jgi:hypothetical protein